MLKMKIAEILKKEPSKLIETMMYGKSIKKIHPIQLNINNTTKKRKSRNFPDIQLPKSRSQFFSPNYNEKRQEETKSSLYSPLHCPNITKSLNENAYNNMIQRDRKKYNSQNNLPYFDFWNPQVTPNKINYPRPNTRRYSPFFESSISFEPILCASTRKILRNKEKKKKKIFVISPQKMKKKLMDYDALNELEFPYFHYSIFSFENEFSDDDYVKAFAYNTHQGNIRDYNEDAIQVTQIENNIKFFAIYDGHGGNSCYNLLRDTLHFTIENFSIKGIANAIIESDKYFINKYCTSKSKSELIDTSGSCALIAAIKDNKCIIANVGDSKAIVVKNNKLFFSTQEHKPNKKKEKQRILANGGKVYLTQFPTPLYQNGNLVEPPWRVSPGKLSVSRTIGDACAKIEKYGGKEGVVIPNPEVTEILLDSEFNYIVLCCDGIYDVLDEEDVIDCVNMAKKEKEGCEWNIVCAEAANIIIKSALLKESFDNVSCVVIALNLY